MRNINSRRPKTTLRIHVEITQDFQRIIYPSTEEFSNSNFPGYVEQFIITPIHAN
jgi:hypothetical protein